MELAVYFQLLKEKLIDNGVDENESDRILLREKATLSGASEKELSYLVSEQRTEILVASAVSRVRKRSQEESRHSDLTEKTEIHSFNKSNIAVQHSQIALSTEKTVRFDESDTVLHNSGEATVQFTQKVKEQDTNIREEEKTDIFSPPSVPLPSDTATIVISKESVPQREEATLVISPSVEKLLAESATIPISKKPADEEKTIPSGFLLNAKKADAEKKASFSFSLSKTACEETPFANQTVSEEKKQDEDSSLHILLEQERRSPTPITEETLSDKREDAPASDNKPPYSVKENTSVRTEQPLAESDLRNKHPRLLSCWLFVLLLPSFVLLGGLWLSLLILINLMLLTLLVAVCVLYLASVLLPTALALYSIVFAVSYGIDGCIRDMVTEIGLAALGCGLALLCGVFLHRVLSPLLTLLKKVITSCNHKLSLLLRNLFRLFRKEVVNL